MMFDYILVTIRYKKLSVLHIRIFDPTDASDGADDQRNPYEFSDEASAYTEHGIPLKRGMYPWGNDGDLFPYSDEVYYRLNLFGQENDIEGYSSFFRNKTEEYVPGINYGDE
jgi:hypothetical protein